MTSNGGWLRTKKFNLIKQELTAPQTFQEVNAGTSSDNVETFTGTDRLSENQTSLRERNVSSVGLISTFSGIVQHAKLHGVDVTMSDIL